MDCPDRCGDVGARPSITDHRAIYPVACGGRWPGTREGDADPGDRSGLTVRIIGEFVVARGGQTYPAAMLGSRKARTLLTVLAVSPD
jgi:hypothetical protein